MEVVMELVMQAATPEAILTRPATQAGTTEAITTTDIMALIDPMDTAATITAWDTATACIGPITGTDWADMVSVD
jgi:hypothetical protein